MRTYKFLCEPTNIQIVRTAVILKLKIINMLSNNNKTRNRIKNLSIKNCLKIKNYKIKNLQNGFTILEISVAISVFLLSIILVGSLYIIAQRSYNKSSNRAEMAQNARVMLDRMSRELRQAANIVTSLPPTDTDPGNPPTEEIFFQDGHDTSRITYIRYYLDGANLERQHKVYYFDTEPDTYVAWNSIDQNNNPPEEEILSDNIVGEYFNNLAFWGANGKINISINLNKNQSDLEIETSVYKRN